MIPFPRVSLTTARHDVARKARAYREAEDTLLETLACPPFVHRERVEGCARCEAFWTAYEAESRAERELDAARARLDAVESQQRDAA